jgi:ferredoxin
LIDAVAAVVGEWSTGTLHFERFSNAANAPHTVADRAFEVQLGYGGSVIKVGPDVSILQAVLAAGADVMYSCQEGTCGSCETTVLDGVVSHRDSLLSATERATGAMLICVSRAAGSRLVLDISRGS